VTDPVRPVPDPDGPRRPGRPRAEPSSSVSTKIAVTDHDRLIAAANKRGLSVSAFVRGALLNALRPPR
jgi:predicted HicB family RNase H-like nuclease